MIKCLHIYSTGLGMYEDALTCIKCGHSLYDDGGVVTLAYKGLNRFLSHEKYPWVIDAANAAIKAREECEK